jgi:hypothetical protein
MRNDNEDPHDHSVNGSIGFEYLAEHWGGQIFIAWALISGQGA